MTQAFKFERPVARVFPTAPISAPTRVPAVKPLSIVQPAPTPDGEAALAASTASHMDQMIRSVDQATARMAELLQQVQHQEHLVADLSQRNAELQARAEQAEADAGRHERQAGEAMLKVEHLQTQARSQVDEQERLKASVDRLISIFGGADAMAALS